jgi:hypothetical protein
MQMNCWIVKTPYDNSRVDMVRARTEAHDAYAALGLDCRLLKWNSCNTIPANWLGYSASCPSPGYDISHNNWRVFDEHAAFMFYMTCGDFIERVETTQ